VNFAIAHAALAFWRTRRLAARLKTRADLERWRAPRLDRFLRDIVAKTPFYAGLAVRTLDELPIVDKATVMANFERLNAAGVSFADVRAALDRGEARIGGLHIGQSTGTSGNRGVFVISEAERFVWLGVLLAKALPDFPLVRHKVALALPGYGALYASGAETGRLTLRFFELGLGIERWREDLVAYDPDTVVGPPKVLRALAERGGFAPRHIFSAAEVLDPLDRAAIESATGSTVREIYMATEGLFGVGCPHGTLHLCEDAVAFEWERRPGSDLANPIVTDFTRRTQVMARYRMNDLIRLSDAPCPCGSPLQAVAAIEGRADDVLLLAGAGGGVVMVTPDVARNAVVDADRRITDFRVVQTGPATVELALAADLPFAAAAAASAALRAALQGAGAGPIEIVMQPGLEIPFDRKLRRVRRDDR